CNRNDTIAHAFHHHQGKPFPPGSHKDYMGGAVERCQGILIKYFSCEVKVWYLLLFPMLKIPYHNKLSWQLLSSTTPSNLDKNFWTFFRCISGNKKHCKPTQIVFGRGISRNMRLIRNNGKSLQILKIQPFLLIKLSEIRFGFFS